MPFEIFHASNRPALRSLFLPWYTCFQVSSGMEAHAGAARRRIHLAAVLLRLPSGHRPGRRQARHVRILQIGLQLTRRQRNALYHRKIGIWYINEMICIAMFNVYDLHSIFYV